MAIARVITELESYAAKLKPAQKDLFDRLYHVTTGSGTLVIPKPMEDWVVKQFGSVESVLSQKIVRIQNRFTYDSASFNYLRANRPMDTDGNGALTDEIAKTLHDQFCDPENFTPADSFGRIHGKYCVTSVNVAKYDALHGLIIFKEHDPLVFDEKRISDYLQTATKWLTKALLEHPDNVYPMLMWNCLWRSGASIIHGHMQVLLAKDMHYARLEYYKDVMNSYKHSYNSDLFSDIYSVHEALGLGFKKSGFSVYANLTAAKNKEVIILGDKDTRLEKLSSVMNHVLTRLVKKAGVRSFNMTVYMRPLTAVPGWEDFPVMVRIVDRGKTSNRTTDVGGMEMYSGTNIVETDPYRLIEAIR